MVTLQKKTVKIISVLIALVFVGSVVAVAVTQFGGIASASGNSNVGTVDYRQVMAQHPQLQSANSELQQAVSDAQKEFEEKSKNMSDQEKSDYYQQTQQRLQQKQQELIEPIQKSVEDDSSEGKADTVFHTLARIIGPQNIAQPEGYKEIQRIAQRH